MLRTLPKILVLLGLLSMIVSQPALADIDVVASIKPIESLVAGVMQGAGQPHLLVAAGSPHTYSLKPSDAEALQKAKLVFWVGPTLEHFLVGPLKTLAANAKIVTLADAAGVTKLPFREGGDWQAHEHEDHGDHEGHGDHEDHGDHEKQAAPDQPGKMQEHADADTDPHMWLDPTNAIAFTRAIAAALETADPTNQALYTSNADKLVARLMGLRAELARQLAPFKTRPYIVFHDAYQYLQHAFGLDGVGSVTVDPEKQPGARRLQDLHDMIARLKVVCVFAEPQFTPRLIDSITEGTKARVGTLDPLGADIKPGAELYFKLMKKNADQLASCLMPAPAKAPAPSTPISK